MSDTKRFADMTDMELWEWLRGGLPERYAALRDAIRAEALADAQKDRLVLLDNYHAMNAERNEYRTRAQRAERDRDALLKENALIEGSRENAWKQYDKAFARAEAAEAQLTQLRSQVEGARREGAIEGFVDGAFCGVTMGSMGSMGSVSAREMRDLAARRYPAPANAPERPEGVCAQGEAEPLVIRVQKSIGHEMWSETPLNRIVITPSLAAAIVKMGGR